MTRRDDILDLSAKITQFWLTHPEWRLAQVVSNAASVASGYRAPDVFYVEDAAVSAGLDELEKM